MNETVMTHHCSEIRNAFGCYDCVCGGLWLNYSWWPRGGCSEDPNLNRTDPQAKSWTSGRSL